MKLIAEGQRAPVFGLFQRVSRFMGRRSTHLHIPLLALRRNGYRPEFDAYSLGWWVLVLAVVARPDGCLELRARWMPVGRHASAGWA